LTSLLGGFDFSPPIAIWTLIAATSAFITYLNLRHAKADRVAVLKVGGFRMEALLMTANGIIRRDRLRFWTFLVWMVLGFVAAYVNWTGNYRGLTVVIGLIFTSVLQLYSSYKDRVDRHRILAEMVTYDEEQDVRARAKYETDQPEQ